MYLAYIPVWVQKLFPQVQWRSNTDAVHLTFDDGPIPEVTPWVLDQLKAYDARATFFCVGENVARYPQIFDRILAEGHAVGNHTYRHLDAWKQSTSTYLEDIDACAKFVDSQLFRPPYGHLTPSSMKALNASGYTLVMWDVLTCDFDQNLTVEDCFQKVIKNTSEGSVIVMHDSQKAWPILQHLLPKVLELSRQKSWKLEPLNAKSGGLCR